MGWLVILAPHHEHTKAVLESEDIDWLDEVRPLLCSSKIILAPAHRAYGSEIDELASQLAETAVARVILTGMAANLCLELHRRALVRRGIDVMTVMDVPELRPVEGDSAKTDIESGSIAGLDSRGGLFFHVTS